MCGYFCIGFIDFMLKSKNLINFTSLFFSNINDKQQFRPNKISEVKDYFTAEIREKELMSKRLSKHIASFDYFDSSLIVLSATSGAISILLFATVIGASVVIESTGFSFAF